jgi:nitric oxide dioxygenase
MADGQTLRISVKREMGGLVSNHLHDHVQVGDTLEVFRPLANLCCAMAMRPWR